MRKHFVALGNDALYVFDSLENFRRFCQARAAAQKTERAGLPDDYYGVEPVRPQEFGGEIVGRVWYMRDASLQEWDDLARMHAED